MTLESRIARLEKQNRGMKGLLGCIAVGIICAAAAPKDAGVFDTLMVRDKLVVGGSDGPAVFIQRAKGEAAIGIADAESKNRALLSLSKGGAMLSLMDRAENNRLTLVVADEANGSLEEDQADLSFRDSKGRAAMQLGTSGDVRALKMNGTGGKAVWGVVHNGRKLTTLP